MATALSGLLERNPHLRARYAAAKKIVRVFRRPAFYEISTRCNLRCEGCYYFADGFEAAVPRDAPIGEWEPFFAAEAARGVSMAYFVGAEPSLEQKRLVIASRYFRHGNVGTNGIVRLDPDIRFRIGVSIWAGEDRTDALLRGATAFRKALKNYEGDERAIALYTVSSWNIGETRAVARMCRDHGLPLTFNLYSPTSTFLSKLNASMPNDGAYFRVSGGGHSPALTPEALARTRETLGELIEDFPDTVVYSHAYNAWSTRPGPLYELGEDGIARHCGSRMIGPMRYFRTDLRQHGAKCGTSDVDCSQCRMYSGGWSSKFAPGSWNLGSVEAFEDWLDMIGILGRIFVLPDESRRARPGDQAAGASAIAKTPDLSASGGPGIAASSRS